MLNGATVALGQIVTRTQLLAGELVFVPDAEENGAPYATFNFKVHDGTSYSADQTFTMNVDPVADPPQIQPPTTIDISEGQSFVGTIVATDTDSPSLTYSINGGADLALFTIDSISGALSFVSGRDRESHTDADSDGIYEVTVQAFDGLLTDSRSLSVTITDVDEFGVTIASDSDVTANEVAENSACWEQPSA